MGAKYTVKLLHDRSADISHINRAQQKRGIVPEDADIPVSMPLSVLPTVASSSDPKRSVSWVRIFRVQISAYADAGFYS